MIPDPQDAGLIPLLPAFRRAREYRLYDAAGARYLDLWQCDGHAILGHRIAGVSTLMKGALSRGLLGDLPSVRSGRLARSLRSLLPTHPHVRVYATLSACLHALSAWSGRRLDPKDLPDPVAGGTPLDGDGSVCLWRPFASAPSGAAALGAGALVPVIPFGLAAGPWAVCFRSDPGRALPPTAPTSPVILEGAAAAVWALARYVPGDVGGALAEGPLEAWRLDGVYLVPRYARERHPAVFRDLLSQGVVISPRYDCPSILPAMTSPGERAGLVGLLRGIPLES